MSSPIYINAVHYEEYVEGDDYFNIMILKGKYEHNLKILNRMFSLGPFTEKIAEIPIQKALQSFSVIKNVIEKTSQEYNSSHIIISQKQKIIKVEEFLRNGSKYLLP